jgi:hypothetical protein
MAYEAVRTAGIRALFSAMLDAVQWRFLLLWLLLMLLPTAVVSLPLWYALGGMLNHSVHATAWAQQFNSLMFGDVIRGISEHAAWFGGAAALALLLTLILLPFLDGMIIGSGRARRTLGFSMLLQSGLVEYGRMFRVMLWSLLPYLVAAALSAAALHLARERASLAVLESRATEVLRVARWTAVVLFVLAQAIVESSRAAFIADSGLRSATRALGRGIRQLLKRPLRTLLFYLVVTGLGLLFAGSLGLARAQVTAVGGEFWLALVLGQLIVLAVGWLRAARLFALARVARLLSHGRRGGQLPPSL